MNDCKIPKQMNFFWIGRMSYMRWLTLHTFVSLNHDWKIYLYNPPSETIIPKYWEGDTDDDSSYDGNDFSICIPPTIIQKQFNPPCPMGAAQMCDLFQWQLLASEGGFYADM